MKTSSGKNKLQTRLVKKSTSESASLFSLKRLATLVLILGVLYWARDVFIPFALATLLSFLLGPLVTRLRRRGFGRVLSVSIVAVLAFALLFSLAWVVTRQLLSFAREFPSYKRNIQSKLQWLNGPFSQELDRTSRAIKGLQAELGTPRSSNDEQPGQHEPYRVELVQPAPNLLQLVHRAVGPLFKPMGTAGLVTVLVVCMLLNREDLRNRLIRLFGRRNLPAATQALDAAARGVSRFLLMQSIINGSYGLAFGLGLFFIGLPNSVLWGFTAAVMRFVPYIGSWIAASIPIIFSLAVSNGWTQTLLAAGLFVLLEVISNYLVEPWLYGTRTGLTPLAVIVAVIFWTWLWGPVGLLLSTPLTVCLVVISKRVPQLEFLTVMLGDEPVLGPKSRFYQRLLALDREEATDLLAREMSDKSLMEVCDTVLIPTLRMATFDNQCGMLEAKRAAFVFACLRALISNLGSRNKAADQNPQSRNLMILSLPVLSEPDELAALLFVKVLQSEGVSAQPATFGDLKAQIDLWCKSNQLIVCLSAISPSATESARRLVKPIRRQFPELPILVGLWNAADEGKMDSGDLQATGANQVVTTLQEGLDAILKWLPVSSHNPEMPATRLS
jgi:predicted PurR-regulated permease PerM